MVFVDTNFINRFLLQDIPNQLEIVNETFDRAAKKELQLCSTDVVFFEVCWSLMQFYSLEEKDILEILYEIIASNLISFQTREILLEAIKKCEKNNLGIEDNYNLVWCGKNNISEISSFDKKLLMLGGD